MQHLGKPVYDPAPASSTSSRSSAGMGLAFERDHEAVGFAGLEGRRAAKVFRRLAVLDRQRPRPEGRPPGRLVRARIGDGVRGEHDQPCRQCHDRP